METLTLGIKPKTQQSPKPQLMNSVLFSKLRPAYSLSIPTRVRPFCTITTTLTAQSVEVTEESSTSSSEIGTVKSRASSSEVTAAAQLKENWLDSLTYPFPYEVKMHKCLNSGDGVGEGDLAWNNAGSNWVVGVDPDVSGALALLKIDESGCSAQVFDSPHLNVKVGKRIRKRLDVKSMVQLLRDFDLPIGTTAYLEQSNPFPKDGKQGWWSGGFNYGLWIGVLVASGFSVVPVPSLRWKNEFELSGGKSTKDDSRRMASELFPALSSSLNRKKDHGRAEALLIAAYGKGCKAKTLGTLAS